jgi:glycosyltransferase involved in cell wall biosynthesis
VTSEIVFPHNCPSVSIGMPAFNDEKHVTRALDSLLAQTYTNFELIISDNCSTDGTWMILKNYASKDRRIRLYRQKENIGALKNFSFVLDQARAEYFMLAASDDYWDSRFVEVLVEKLTILGPNYSAVMTEARYFIDEKVLDFFSEGHPFYEFHSNSGMERLEHMLKYNYGNLAYSLFRRSRLQMGASNIFDIVQFAPLNEISYLLLVAYSGNWMVIETPLFFKRVRNCEVFEQAQWEKVGGKLPKHSIAKTIMQSKYLIKYHMYAVKDISRTFDLLKLKKSEKYRLNRMAFWILVHHVFSLISGRKSKAF